MRKKLFKESVAESTFEKTNAARYRRDAENLHQTALDAANSGHKEMLRRIGEQHGQHLSALTSIARHGVHTTLQRSIKEAAPNFVADAKSYFRRVSPGTKFSDIGAKTAHDILPSLLTHSGIAHIQNRYDRANFRQNDLEQSNPSRAQTEHQHVISHIGTHPFSEISREHLHRSVSGINLNSSTGGDQIGLWHHKIRTGSDMPSSHQSRSTIPEIPQSVIQTARQSGKFGDFTQHAAETSMVDATKKATDYINSIPNLSEEQKEHLHTHFTTQFRHHYMAGVANPQKFTEYHSGRASQEQQSQGRRRQEDQQRQSSGGRRRRGEWPHPEQPHEILGVGQNAGPDEIKKAFRKLAMQHHPDQGGNEAMFVKVSDAHEHMMKAHGLKEWVIFTADWITKRYRK